MKSLIWIILFSLISSIAFADNNCDWSQIKKLPDGGYEYNPTLNICVGQLVRDSSVKDQQIVDLTKAIDLKNLAITNADARTALWTKSAEDEQDRIASIDQSQRTNEYIAFGLGILLTIGAAYAVHATTH